MRQRLHSYDAMKHAGIYGENAVYSRHSRMTTSDQCIYCWLCEIVAL